jgi:hypothetical protein
MLNGKLRNTDFVRFKNQMEEVKSKGYFIMEDGSKSSDEKNLIRIKVKTVKKEKIQIGD